MPVVQVNRFALCPSAFLRSLSLYVCRDRAVYLIVCLSRERFAMIPIRFHLITDKFPFSRSRNSVVGLCLKLKAAAHATSETVRSNVKMWADSITRTLHVAAILGGVYCLLNTLTEMKIVDMVVECKELADELFEAQDEIGETRK